jgi:hypothetical protein
MDEAQFKLEARLAGIEYMVMSLYVLIHRLAASSPAQILQAHEEAIRRLEQATIPGIQAVQSDAFCAEVQEAVRRLLDGIEAMAGVPKKSP